MHAGRIVAIAVLFVVLPIACSQDRTVSLPPVSYWSVTTIPNTLSGCPSYPYKALQPVTEPARMTFTPPGTVTLETLFELRYGVNGFRTGTLSDDGTLRLGKVNPFVGWLDEHSFRVTHTTYDGACSETLRGLRFTGPSICDVSSAGEEASLKKAVDEVVNRSHMPELVDFLWNQEHRKSFSAMLQVTTSGEHTWVSDHWSAASTASTATVFNFPDGSRLSFPLFDRSESILDFRLEGAGGWLLEGMKGDDYFTITLDHQWSIRWSYLYFATSPYMPALIGSGQTLGEVLAYETPVGTMRVLDNADGSAQGFTLKYSLPEYPITVTMAAEVTLRYGNRTKAFSSAFKQAYCPYAGEGLLTAFPELLTKMGICSASSSVMFPRECAIDP